MIHAKIDVKLHSHPKARKAGAAMATWTWALCYIRDHETDGFVPDASIGAAWVGEAQARKDAAVLVRVGLWEAVAEGAGPDGDGGWRLRKYSDKNETRAEIDERRSGDRGRKRMGSFRNPDGIRTESKSACSDSVVGIPGSGSGSVISESRSEDPDSTPREAPANDVPPVTQVRPFADLPDPMADAPDWWGDVVRRISGDTLGQEGVLNVRECWMAYAGHRAEKRRPASSADACTWLTTVMVPKAREALRVAARDRDRDAAYVRSKQHRTGPEMPVQSPDEAKRDAAAFAARIAARRAKDVA